MAWLAHGQQSASADMVLLNGAITVGDASATEHEALAIRGEHILAVGTNAEIAALAQPQTTVVDLEGRRVIPGLIDSHMHLVRAGLTWNDELHWDGIASLDAALALIAQAAAIQPEGSWIRVVGAWHPGQFAEKRGPSRADLNAVAPRHPVYVQMLYEDALINDAALRICEIATETSDPQGGVFERDAAGAPTGRMRGVAAFNYVLQRMGSATLDQQIASTRAMLQAFGRVGLTTGIDTGGLGAAWDIYQPIFALARQGNMGFRARLYVGATERGREQQQIADWMERFSGDPAGSDGPGDAYLKVVGAGEIIIFGYHDLEGLTPFSVPPASRRELAEITRMVTRRGWPMTIHAVWDTTIAAVLDVWEEVDREIPLAGRRFSIAHADMITAGDLARVRRMGIGITVQDRLIFRSADSATAWGAEKAHVAPPLRRMLDLGIPVGAGTDATRVTSYNPWVSLWWLITGCSVDGAPPRDQQQCLSRAEALRLYTSGSAWFSFDEQRLGTLEPGKLADLVVLSDDYFTVPTEAIPSLQSVLTVVGGRLVYAAGAFAALASSPDQPSPSA